MGNACKLEMLVNCWKIRVICRKMLVNCWKIRVNCRKMLANCFKIRVICWKIVVNRWKYLWIYGKFVFGRRWKFWSKFYPQTTKLTSIFRPPGVRAVTLGQCNSHVRKEFVQFSLGPDFYAKVLRRKIFSIENGNFAG